MDTISRLDRFADKIALADDGCIVWIASTNNRGYGTFSAGPVGTVGAHRWSYEYHVGDVPKGVDLDHLCRNRACVNPEHLEPVTHRENLMRSPTIPAINASKTHCPLGHSYSGDNLSMIVSTNSRVCITCRRANARRRNRLSRKA